MNDHLDRTVRTVLADIVATTPSPEAHPTRLVPVEHEAAGRRPVFAIAAAVLAVVGIGVGLFAMSRQDSGRPTGSTTLASNVLDRLLYPAGMDVTQVYKIAFPTSRIAATLVSRDRRVFSVSLMENYWEQQPTDREQRVLNGNRFSVGNEDGTMAYTTLDTCMMLTIGDRSPSGGAWSVDATTLLETIEITESAVSMSVPAGWTSVGGGPLGSMYQVSFTTSAGPMATLFQMPDASLGALAAQVRMNTAEATEIDGDPAWVFVQPESSWLYLAWDGPAGAVVLGVEGGTLEGVMALADTMSNGHGAAWAAGLKAHPSNTASAWTAPTTAGQCGTRTLTVVP